MSNITKPAPVTGALLSQDEAAQLLGLSNPKTLAAWRLRRCGPPYRKVGSRLVRYDENELRLWAKRREA